MGAGKVLILIGGIVTLVSLFFLTLIGGLADSHYYGLGFIFNLPDIFSDADLIATGWGEEVMIVYILAIVFIVVLISGILQLVGLASRPVAIIGSILPIIMAILIILIRFDILEDWEKFLSLFYEDSIVDGILPFNIELGDISLGTYTLLAGGVLGLIGGII
ncbi:hypothetical protein LCGC14_2703780, partial [marine sediment metagenome]